MLETEQVSRRDENELHNRPRNLTAIESSLVYPSADGTLAEFEPIQRIWKDWLRRGLPSLRIAVPGTGKSYPALDLARHN